MRGTTRFTDIKPGMCVQDLGQALQRSGALVMPATFDELLFAFSTVQFDLGS